MRLDLFLRNSGLIPRRPVAKRACDEGLVEINGKAAKASAQVRVGQRITLRLGMKITEHDVLALPQRPVAKSQRDDYARLISTERVDLDP